MPAAATAEDFVARLIAAIRADARAHRIQLALGCGGLRWQHEVIAAAEHQLALSVEDCLTPIWPSLPADGSTGLGRRVLALARQAALAPEAPDARAEAAVIAGMLAASLARPAASPVEATATPAPPDQAAVSVRPPQQLDVGTVRAAVAGPAHTPPDRVHDPPVCAG